jgi:hypothetical protein
MPSLSDAKKCYVGNVPLSRIISGTGFQVWPKAPPPPFGPFDNITLYLKRGDGINPPSAGNEKDYIAVFMAWQVNPRPSTCSRASAYTTQYFKDGNSQPWQDFSYFGNPNTLNWMPSSYPNVMVAQAFGGDPLNANYSFRVKYDGPSGIVYSNFIKYNFSLPVVPIQYQENECNNRP